MAKRTFPDGFKIKAVAYPSEHPEKTMKECAEELGIGASTLRRWIKEAKDAEATEAVVVENTEESAAVEASIEQKECQEVEAAFEEAAPVLENMLDEMEAADEEPQAQVGESLEESKVAPAKETSLEADAVEEAQLPSDEEPPLDDGDDEPSLYEVDDDFVVQCKSNPEADRTKLRSAGAIMVEVSARVGDVLADASDAVERAKLYKKRYDLKKLQKKLQKEKQKRLGH